MAVRVLLLSTWGGSSSSRYKHNMCDFECVRESDWLLNLRIVSCNHQARIFMTCFFFSFSWLFTKAVESAAAAVPVPAHSPGCRPCRGSWRSQLSRSPFFPCCLRTGWSQHSWSVLVQTQVTKRVSSLSAHFWPPGKLLASFGDGNKPSPDSISEMLTSHCASSRHIKPSEFITQLSNVWKQAYVGAVHGGGHFLKTVERHSTSHTHTRAISEPKEAASMSWDPRQNVTACKDIECRGIHWPHVPHELQLQVWKHLMGCRQFGLPWLIFGGN